MTIAEKIYKIRTGLNLSQKEFAEKIGASQSAINYWENGKRQPRLEQLQKIADTLNIDIGMLLFDDSKTIKENLKDFPNDILIESFTKGVKLSPKQIMDANFILEFSSKDYEFEELEAIKLFADFIKNSRKKYTKSDKE